MSRPIRCPYCQRTYKQFQVIGSRCVFSDGGASLVAGRIEEFQCRCGQSFIPVGPEPKEKRMEEGEDLAA